MKCEHCGYQGEGVESYLLYQDCFKGHTLILCRDRVACWKRWDEKYGEKHVEIVCPYCDRFVEVDDLVKERERVSLKRGRDAGIEDAVSWMEALIMDTPMYYSDRLRLEEKISDYLEKERKGETCQK